MIERSVPDLAALDALDHDEVLEGYRDGLAGEPAPGDNRSLSYWHGWRNGACDSNLRVIDPEQRYLAHEYLARERAKRS